MALNSRTDNLPRDPSAIDTRYNNAGTIATVVVLLIVAAALGLYFMYAGSDSSPRIVNLPSTQVAPAPAPATRPTQTPTP